MNPKLTILYQDGETDLSLGYQSCIETMHLDDFFETFVKALMAIGFTKATINKWGQDFFDSKTKSEEV